MLQGTRRALLRGGKRYIDKMLGHGPIAYWVQGEKTGAVARCYVNPAQNGAYTAVTLGQLGIGDGNTSASYDGATSYTNIYSATLAAAFSGVAGTAMIWARVSAAGVWTDGAFRYLFNFQADANNQIFIAKAIANSTMNFQYKAGAVTSQIQNAAMNQTAFINVALTWDKTADQVRAFLNGAQTGATLNGLGVWAGAPGVTTTCIGSASTVPATVWSGYLAHCALWNRALAPAEIAALAVI
jgi:hypothetical protein